MLWHISHRADRAALPLANEHYSRQKPGTPQFVAPATNIVLLTLDRTALWVTTWSKHADHAWPGAWVCALFRNTGPALSSDLIVQAVRVTRWKYGDGPEHGMITFIDEAKIRRKRDPGRCFLRAGFVRLDERTKVNNLIVLQMRSEDMPEPEAPLGTHPLELFTTSP